MHVISTALPSGVRAVLIDDVVVVDEAVIGTQPYIEALVVAAGRAAVLAALVALWTG